MLQIWSFFLICFYMLNCCNANSNVASTTNYELMVYVGPGTSEVHCLEKDSKNKNIFVRLSYTNINSATSLLGYSEGSFSFIANNVAVVNYFELYPSGKPFHRVWNSTAGSCVYRYDTTGFVYECQNSGAGSTNTFPLQSFRVEKCKQTPQKCLGVTLTDLQIAEQYCFWNPKNPSKPLKNPPNNMIYSSASSGKDPHTYHGTNIGRFNTLGAYQYTWPSSTCSKCDLLEKGFYSTDSISASTSSLLLMTATYNAISGPIKGQQGPSIFGFTSKGELVARSCDTSLNSEGYYYITNCFYSKRKVVITNSNKDKKNNDKVVNELLGYYPSSVFNEINEIIYPNKM